MATVYSLICWGGSSGKSVTVSSSTDYVTLTNHGLRNGKGVQFTSGTLPTVSGTALALNTTYYAKSISTSTFELYYESSLTTKIDFTSTGSSLVLKGVYYKSLSDTSRWSGGIYDGRFSWNTGRASASQFDTEVVELGDDFDDIQASTFSITVPAARVLMTSMVNGARSSGYHNGVVGAGYVAMVPNGGYIALGSNRQNVEYEGFSAAALTTTSSGTGISTSSRGGNKVRNMIVFNNQVSTASENGISLAGAMTRVEHCLITGLKIGLVTGSYTYGSVFANNTVVNNGTGIYAESSATTTVGNYNNNAVFGNTINWSRAAPTGVEGANKNTGESRDTYTAWSVGTGASYITVTSSDFANYSSGNYKPSSTSLLIDSGVNYYLTPSSDLIDAEVPNYNNGGSEAVDVGAYEYDHGYGPHPASATISLTSVVSGSRVLITKASDGTVLYNDVPGTSLSFSTTHIGDFNVVVRKATASPFYREFNASGTTVADQTTAIKCLQQLDE